MLARFQYTYDEDMGVDRVGQDKDVGDVALPNFLCEECQCMDSIVESDLQCSIAREEGEHRCDVKVMKKDPV